MRKLDDDRCKIKEKTRILPRVAVVWIVCTYGKETVSHSSATLAFDAHLRSCWRRGVRPPSPPTPPADDTTKSPRATATTEAAKGISRSRSRCRVERRHHHGTGKKLTREGFTVSTARPHGPRQRAGCRPFPLPSSGRVDKWVMKQRKPSENPKPTSQEPLLCLIAARQATPGRILRLPCPMTVPGDGFATLVLPCRGPRA
ncbi:hypothetical protein C8R46DRAFT_1039391 [Mycena filopes]|nr:hypothetical protein C8R46DRAFT_1039391 [Mycena filopes]